MFDQTTQELQPRSQGELELLFSKYQLMDAIRYEFIAAGFDAALEEKEIPVEFGINCLAQLVLHKRAPVGTLTGILRKFFEEEENPSQACCDMLFKMAEHDFIDFTSMGNCFVMRFNITEDVQEKIDQFQYPLPMIEEPSPITHNRQTGYRTIRGSLILRDNHHDDDICLDHINRVNAVSLRVNADIVDYVRNSWRNLDKKKEHETLADYEKRVKAFEKYDRVSKDVIDTIVLQQDRFWLTHRYDKRGRTYCQGYHVNYQGNDWNKAVVEFAEGEKLND